MLSKNPVFPSIRVSNLVAAKEFYESKLGLKIIYDTPGELLLLAGKNSRIYLYEGSKSVPEHTVAVFYVDNIKETVNELKEKGVVFERYNTPDIKTDLNGIAAIGPKKGAWFKDPDGHILALSQIK
jgi:catechol 2,3-dioxygenase-like lactoylglutathione lyase family enzyme